MSANCMRVWRSGFFATSVAVAYTAGTYCSHAAAAQTTISNDLKGLKQYTARPL